MPSVGSMPCAASPTTVTRDDSQSSAGSRKPNGIANIDSGSMPSTSARAAGCQPSSARSIDAFISSGVSAVHSAAGGTTVPGSTLQLIITYGGTSSTLHVGRELAAASLAAPRGRNVAMSSREPFWSTAMSTPWSRISGSCASSSGVIGVRP